MQVSRSYIPFLIASYFPKIVFIFDFGWQPKIKQILSLDWYTVEYSKF